MAINSRPSPFDFYRPGQFSGPDWKRGPLWEHMTRENPQGYFGNWLGQQGLMGNDVQSDFARSLYNRMYGGYESAQFDQPDLDWFQYLDQYQGKMRDVTHSFDPQSRGLRPSQYVGGARRLPRGN